MAPSMENYPRRSRGLLGMTCTQMQNKQEHVKNLRLQNDGTNESLLHNGEVCSCTYLQSLMVPMSKAHEDGKGKRHSHIHFRDPCLTIALGEAQRAFVYRSTNDYVLAVYAHKLLTHRRFLQLVCNDWLDITGRYRRGGQGCHRIRVTLLGSSIWKCC